MESGRGEFKSHSVVHLPSFVSGVLFVLSDPLQESWNLVTLTSSRNGAEVRPIVQLWKLEDNLTPKSQQTIICHLPIHPQARIMESSSQISSENPHGRYIVVSDRFRLFS